LVGEDTASPYQYAWDTTTYSDGQHTLYASILQAPERPGEMPPLLDSPKITVTVDNSPPTIPIVSDDGIYTNSNNELHSSWTSSADPESGVKEYQYAIGTAKGATDLVSWSSNGLNLDVTRTGLSLTEGQTYYITVKAINGVNLSNVGYSDGIIVDTTAPVITITSPANGFVSTAQTITVSGTIDDNQATVTVNGSPATISNGAFSSELLLAEGLNTIIVSSTDSAGNRSSYSIAVTYQPDKLPPPAGEPIAVFSSPYDNQVITENSLKIGGSFDSAAGISTITVNGQACTLDLANNTFTGPMLISPGEARRRNVASDNSEYIIMSVNPATHSGKNTLKVSITDSFGRTDKQELTFHYYQLFVTSNAFEENEYRYDDGPTFSLRGKNTQSYNKDLFYNPPYANWIYPEMAYRDEDLWSYPFTYNYSKDKKAFYYAKNCPSVWLMDYGSLTGARGHYSINTKLLLHTPPLKDMPFILVLKNCGLFEYTPMFIGSVHYYVPNAIAGYSLNGRPITPIDPLDSYSRVGYVLIDEFTPDTDYPVEFQIPKYGGEKGIQTSAFGYTNQYFYLDDVDTITGDILLDSNNDGFLGGDDNVVEQVAPGCVFWVNDDDDYDESSVHTNDSGAVNSNGNDGADEVINGIRDLEDFMPIDLTIPNIKEWANNQSVKFYLKAEGNGKIRVFKRVDDNDEEGTKTYLVDLDKSIKQYTEKMKFLLPSSEKEGQLLDPSWFNSEGKFYGIFEGVTAGALKLTLEVELGTGQDKKRVVLDEAYITLKNVKDMYKLINIREGPTMGTDDGLLRYRNKEESTQIFAPDPKKAFIWAHGYNNTLEGSAGSADIVYKRLYQTDFRGAFIFISWDTADWIQPFSAVNFNGDWVNSFRSARITADIIKDIRTAYPGAKIDLGAHSLGNSLMCYALRLLAGEGSSPIDNLMMAEPAVPGEVFWGLSRTPYYDIVGVRHDFFDNMYANSLNAVTGKIYNTYSTNDGALRLAFKGNNLLLGLPTPLDDRYNLVNDTTLTIGNEYTDPLGLASANSPYNKFVSEPFYPPDYINGANENTRPYGIRQHVSMSVEYYYDVQEFYYYLINLKKPEEAIR